MNKLMAAYLAGLIDGEGYLGILQVKKGEKSKWSSLREFQYIPVMKVCMTDRDIIEWLYKSFGGTFETRQHPEKEWKSKVSYGWTMRKNQVIEIVRLVYPFLRVKKKQAQILLRFPLGQVGTIISDSVYEIRGKLRDEIRTLNHKGAAVETN